MCIKATMRYYYSPNRMAKIQKTCSQGCGETETLIYCGWDHGMGQSLSVTVWRFLIKLNIGLPYDPATAILSIYPKEFKLMAT